MTNSSTAAVSSASLSAMPVCRITSTIMGIMTWGQPSLIRDRVPAKSDRTTREAPLPPPAFSASKRARYLHVCGMQVAKAVLLRGPDGYFLAVLPSTHAIDLDVLSRHKGGPVRLARIDEAASIFRDCEWGTVSP